MTNKIVHVCLDIEGALRWPKQRQDGLLRDFTTGRVLAADEVRAVLRAELAKGHRVLPMTRNCEGFSFVDGCPGHKAPDGL